MSDRDIKMIDEAWGIDCIKWYEIDTLIEQAESPEAKEKLRIIRNHKYHLEEIR